MPASIQRVLLEVGLFSHPKHELALNSITVNGCFHPVMATSGLTWMSHAAQPMPAPPIPSRTKLPDTLFC